MVYSSSNGQDRRRPVFFVPESFCPEDLLSPESLAQAQGAYYLMHAIVTRMAYGEREGARLKKRYLENVMGRWTCQPVLTSLLECGEVRRVGQYVPGQQCFRYSPAEWYRSEKLRLVYPTEPGLLQRLAQAGREHDDRYWRNPQPIHDVWERWQRQLSIEIDQAREMILGIPAKSNPYDVQTMMVERIQRREYRFVVDDYGRVHNAITSLSKALRPALRMQGQPTGHIDIINSQPAMLALLLTHGTAVPSTAGGPPGVLRSIYDRRGTSPSEGARMYCELAAKGYLYEYLMDETGLTRADVKRGLLRDVFGRRQWYPSLVEDVFRDCFPAVYEFIRDCNRDDHAALLRALQGVESDLVIRRIGARLSELQCPIVSLHDAVYCARSDIRCVEQAFRDAFEQAGLQLALQVDEGR